MNESQTLSNREQTIDEKKIQLLYMSFYMTWLKFQAHCSQPELVKLNNSAGNRRMVYPTEIG